MMIWYRHWLEMRGGLLFILIGWAFFVLTITGPFESLRWTSWRAFPWDPFMGPPLLETSLGLAIGDQVLVWAEFAGRILPMAFLAAMALAGSGVTSLMRVSDASASYTLTLPISRRRLICTRLIAAVGAMVLAGGIATLLGLTILMAGGYSIPLTPVVQSLVLGIVCATAVLAVLGAVATSLSWGWALLTFMGVFGAMIVPISYTVAAPARGETPWGMVAVLLVVTAMAVLFTIHKDSAREF